MYVGHIDDQGEKEHLKEHLLKVANLCSKFAESIGLGDLAYVIGLLHDVGKYSEKFQKKLLGKSDIRVDHSTAGGQLIYDLIGIQPLAYPIFGHHGGLPNGGSEHDSSTDGTLYGRLKKSIECYDDYKAEINIPKISFPDINYLDDDGITYSLVFRMLFSCLVDADYLETERFMQSGKVQRDGFDDIDMLYERISNYIKQFDNPQNELNKRRTEILSQCSTAAESEKGLFALTVPTGGGKTISSMLFALKHAQKNNLKRVIYVIPYTSIIEQNAKVFKEILGDQNVIEHHSNVIYSNDENSYNNKHLATENWDAPIIVTTNVQFFESFFSSKPSKCRKLHNVAESVIIFDETQMFPRDFLKPCMSTISNLIYSYNCSAVFCTATQPSLNFLIPKEIDYQEIVLDKIKLSEDLKRTDIIDSGFVDDEALFDKLKNERQALCIVNTKRQAQVLYSNEMDNKDEWFHLSTLITPNDRRCMLKEIKRRLDSGEPCRLISTSLVEAGVDLDFPTVFRAYAGLDSIIQAAGRCNREGKLKEGEKLRLGEVYIFRPDEKYNTPSSIKFPLEAFLSVKNRFKKLDSLEAIDYYYKSLFHQAGDLLDKSDILGKLNKNKNQQSYPFRDVEQLFKIISEDTVNIIIPSNEESQKLLSQLKYAGPNRQLIRSISQYCVSIYTNQLTNLKETGCLEQIDESYYYITSLSLYDNSTGLKVNSDSGKNYWA